MAHSREASLPRMPFVTPIISQKAYREPVHTTPKSTLPQPSSASKTSKATVPTLNVITGFDNPRTPPAPGHGFNNTPKHSRNASLQDRRAAKVVSEKNSSLGVQKPAVTELSPSDRTLLIGFEQALQKLNIQTSAKTLNIQTRHENIISPITPSIIVTGVPKDDEEMDNMFLKPIDPRHRSSVYSQSTNLRRGNSQKRLSASSAPPVPVIPHDMLDPRSTLPHNADSSRITSWNTDVEDEDHSVTYVGSDHPTKDSMHEHLLERTNTVATKYRSQGWWNTITTPFLQRTATLDKRFPRSPASQPSPHLSPQPSAVSSTAHALSEANVAALLREAVLPASMPTTPHLADEKRQTMGFFGEATPKTATFPPVPPLPSTHQNRLVMSPEFVDPGAFGEAAEYFEACWHDMTSAEPFYACINHDCRKWAHKDAVADARSRELFLASAAVDRANQTHHNRQASIANSVHKELPGLPAPSPPQQPHTSPSLVDHVQPSDSVSQVAERRAEADAAATRSRGLPETPQQAGSRQTIFSDDIGSPEVAEATAMPIMRAMTPEPLDVHENRAVPDPTPRQPAVPAMLSHVAAPGPRSSAPRETQSQIPTPLPATSPAPVPAPMAPSITAPVNRSVQAPYPDSAYGVPPSRYVPPPPPPPPGPAPYPEASTMPESAPPLTFGASRETEALEPAAARSVTPAASSYTRQMSPFASSNGTQAEPQMIRTSPQPRDAPVTGNAPLETGRNFEGPSPRSILPVAHQHTASHPGNGGMLGVSRSIEDGRPGYHENVDLPADQAQHQAGQLSVPQNGHATRENPAAATSRNPFKRQMPTPIDVTHSPRPQSAVSPAVYTPNMAREAEIGNAIPLQTSHQATSTKELNADYGSRGESVTPVGTKTFTKRAVIERYDQKQSSPKTQEEKSIAVPAAAVVATAHKDLEASRDVNEEKTAAELPPRPTKQPGKLASLLAKWRTKRQQRPKKTKEEKKRRRCCYFIFFALFALVISIVLSVMLLTVKHSSIPAQSSWLNLTDYPPIPTGIATIARPNAVLEQSGCVQPQTMWSCAVPREQQDGIKPNNPDQPNFRLEIMFQNGTSMSNGTTISSKTRQALSSKRDTANMWNSSPAPPSEDDQIFIGNTSDHNMAPYDGEQTPFFITFLPVSTTPNNLRRDIDDNPSSSLAASSPSSTPTSTPSSSSSTPSSASSSTDPFPDLATLIPTPSLNADGSLTPAVLLPLPSSQPLHLYNRNLPTEHYGFYTYFDRTIFLTTVTTNTSASALLTDVPGGAPSSTALKLCTWSQTRFLVQIWTNSAANSARPLLNGSSTATAAAAGNITAHSESTFTQPGSFPYPVTITVDRHGGNAKEKMVYCYGVKDGKVDLGDKKISLEDRGFGGSLIHSSGGFIANETAGDPGAPIDGGTGGCGCSWQNFQST